MKTEQLKEQGLTEEQISFVMKENGKDISKEKKEIERLTADRDAWKEKAETAEETLKSFDGIDPEGLQQQLEEANRKLENAEKEYKEKIYERDFSDTLNAEIESIKFSSDAAKRSVIADIKEAGLKLKDGKILGLNDLIAQIKEKDASAFVDESQQKANESAANFTTPAGNSNPSQGEKISMSELMRMKNENPGLDIKQYM